MIKNILFDMGGVIFQQDTAEAFRRFRQAGIDPDIYMGEYGQKGFFLDVETGRIDADEFCRQMARVVGRESVSHDEAMHCWLGFIRGVEQSRLDRLAELRRHYHLCLLTNTNPFIMEYTRSSRFSPAGKPISDYFDSLFCSYEMKRYKPNSDFFSYALQADGMRPDECIFIDDSAKNIGAAEAVGIRGLHVDTNADWTAPLAQLLEADV